MDDTERSHLIIDKDTGLVFDIRKDMDMARLDRQTTTSTTGDSTNGDSSRLLGSEAS